MRHDVKVAEDVLNNYLKETKLELSQNQYDALAIHVHLRGGLTNSMKELIISNDEMNWEEALLGGQNEDRYIAENQLYFHNDYDWIKNRN